jgi:hypothetical protein
LASENGKWPVRRVAVAQCCFQWEEKTESCFKKGHDIPTQMYSRSNSTQSPASGAVNVSETRLIYFGRLCEVCVRRSVFFYTQSGGCASVGLLT